MDFALQGAEEGEESPVPVTTQPYHSQIALRRAPGTTLGSATTPEFRPRLQIRIPDAIQDPFTASLPETTLRAHPSSYLLTSNSLEQSPSQHRSFYPVTHSNSRSWTSNPRMAEQDRWSEIERNLKRIELIPRSPFVPHNFDEWLSFRRGRVEDDRLNQARRVQQWQDTRLYPLSGIAPVAILPAMAGTIFDDGFSTVLCQQTMWSPWYSPREMRPQAPWPCPEEMKEEGDERNTSRFGRFLGLPRVPGNETVVWKQKNYLPPLPFDEVWRLPSIETFEAIWRPTERDMMEKMQELLGQEMMDALDCVESDSF